MRQSYRARGSQRDTPDGHLKQARYAAPSRLLNRPWVLFATAAGGGELVDDIDDDSGGEDESMGGSSRHTRAAIKHEGTEGVCGQGTGVVGMHTLVHVVLVRH